MNVKTIGLLAAGIFLQAQTVYAAPGKLAEAPLFLGTAVDPNIFLIFDDSGSMWWEQIYESGFAGFETLEGAPKVGKFVRFYWHPHWHPDHKVMPPAGYQHPDSSVTWDEDMWIMRNHNANKLFYNPNTDYKPWSGLDSDGNPLYKDADPEHVYRHPNEPKGKYTDLTKSYPYEDFDGCDDGCKLKDAYFIPSYYTWIDDGDGIIETTDKHELVQIKPKTKSYPSGRTYAEEIQNFANWFQYYRKREFSAKASMGSVINSTDAARMGLDAFNAKHQEDVKSMGVAANKSQLLKSLYTIKSSKITPARKALYRVGLRFQSSKSPTPILPASEGGECQQNFALLMTDGFYNGKPPAKPPIWNNDKSDKADNGFDGNQYESIDGGNYEDEHSQTLADVAMHFYETDLRPDLANKVPTQEGVDLADHQHLSLYTVSFGLKGSLDPAKDDPLNEGFEWPSPWTDNAHKVDDLWHAAYNGRGQYLSAHNPEELEAALTAAVADIADRTATATAASVTSARLTTSSKVFLSQFSTNRWKGTVFAYGIKRTKSTDSRGNPITVKSLTDAPLWSAAQELDNRADPEETRVILTYNGNSYKGKVKGGVPFKWSKLTRAIQNDLLTNPEGETDSKKIGKARLAYLRGDRSNEGTGLGFRQRGSLLGDIVHSTPEYIAKSNLPWPDKAPFPTGSRAYSKFKATTQGRKGVIYVGANDGMLHAFDEKTGRELMAYIPSYLFSSDFRKGLHYLTHPDYAHRYYHDQTSVITDVYLNGSWHTILVSGQGAGGKGYFILDITKPDSFSEARASKIVLGEFDYIDDADLGYSFSRPEVGMTNDGKFSIVFGNGYNDSGDGEAKLFILDIEKGIDGDWSASDYREISTGVGSKKNRNGLSSPQLVDLDGNGTVDRAYAGDLFGNMWAFDLSASKKTSWKTAYGKQPLFTTEGKRPITTKPAVSLHPTIESDDKTYPNLMVTFGSGQYLTPSDRDSSYDNNFYGVWDRGQAGLKPSKLMKQAYRSGFSSRVLDRKLVDYTSEYGWYIELPDSGERSITDSLIRSGIVIFNTNVPTATPCQTGGYGYRFAVDLKNGGSPAAPVIDLNDDGVVDEKDYLDEEDAVVESATLFNQFLNRDTLTRDYLIEGAELKKLSIQPPRKEGRLSWQEMLRND